MQFCKRFWFSVIALLGIVFLLGALPASAQSCALCYTQAASSGARMIQALKSGIIILIAPPTFMTMGVLLVCYRKRYQTRDCADAELIWEKDHSLTQPNLSQEDSKSSW